MILLEKETGPLSLQRGIKKLFAQLEMFLLMGKTDSSKNNFIRFETEIRALDLLPWLNAQKNPVKVYWQDRSNDYAVAAVDSADAMGENGQTRDQLIKLENRLRTAPQNLKYFGGLAFAVSNENDPLWDKFGKLYFVLPRIELSRQKDKTILACQALANTAEIKKTMAVLNHVALKTPDVPTGLPLPENRLDTPSQLLWEKHACEILSLIKKNSCQKVVLARQVKLEFREKINAVLLLTQLTRMASHCFCFFFQFKEGETFLGASPERLYRRKHRALQTEALAGTRPRGISKTEDVILQTQLKTSGKDRNEQAIVIGMVENTLLSLCKTFTREQTPSLLNWNGGHHLITRFEGELKDNIRDPQILLTLNPTPAVAGTPTRTALKTITRLEPFSRGWYAGPVGYLSRNQSEFSVAIRSGLLKQKDLYLYAGAGIVNGSVPHAEWDETENKLINFLKIFDADKK